MSSVIRVASSARPLVSILTPTIPGRERFLSECAASVRSQTLPAWKYEHLVLLDFERLGCSRTVNKLAEEARGEWLMILADDDLMLPACLEAHLAADDEGVDIVYAPPLVWGEPPDEFCGSPPGIPSLSLIRTESWRRLGGYDERADHQEDRRLYEKAMERSMKFVRAEGRPTWVYRFHGQNKSRLF